MSHSLWCSPHAGTASASNIVRVLASGRTCLIPLWTKVALILKCWIERQRIRKHVSLEPVAEPVPCPSMLPALFNPSSLTLQPSCPSVQLSSNADHAHAIPSNDEAHDGRESSLVAPNPRAVYFPCHWRAPACPFHQRYRAVC